MATSTRKSAAKQVVPKKARVDWDAVERDYRTDKFTLRELAAKYTVTHTTISRRAEKQEWTKDLTNAIRQATNAKLVQQSVQQQCTTAHQSATETVLAAAELNKQVILSHRQELQSSRAVASGLLSELSQAALLAEESELLAQILAGEGAEPVDEARARAVVHKALSLQNRIGGVKSLIDAFAKLQVSERVAFGLPIDGIGQDKPEIDSVSQLLNMVNGSKLPLATS